LWHQGTRAAKSSQEKWKKALLDDIHMALASAQVILRGVSISISTNDSNREVQR